MKTTYQITDPLRVWSQGGDAFVERVSRNLGSRRLLLAGAAATVATALTGVKHDTMACYWKRTCNTINQCYSGQGRCTGWTPTCSWQCPINTGTARLWCSFQCTEKNTCTGNVRCARTSAGCYCPTIQCC